MQCRNIVMPRPQYPNHRHRTCSRPPSAEGVREGRAGQDAAAKTSKISNWEVLRPRKQATAMKTPSKTTGSPPDFWELSRLNNMKTGNFLLLAKMQLGTFSLVTKMRLGTFSAQTGNFLYPASTSEGAGRRRAAREARVTVQSRGGPAHPSSPRKRESIPTASVWSGASAVANQVPGDFNYRSLNSYACWGVLTPLVGAPSLTQTTRHEAEERDDDRRRTA